MGQLVQSYSFSTETINKSISVAELSNGIYYLRLSDDTSASVIKILKQ